MVPISTRSLPKELYFQGICIFLLLCSYIFMLLPLSGLLQLLLGAGQVGIAWKHYHRYGSAFHKNYLLGVSTYLLAVLLLFVDFAVAETWASLPSLAYFVFIYLLPFGLALCFFYKSKQLNDDPLYPPSPLNKQRYSDLLDDQFSKKS